jgi:hypothetical protein
VAAIVAAIVQLSGVFGEKSHWLGVAELVLVVLALGCVLAAMYFNCRDEWIAQRSIAERMRSLKFKALLDPRMWGSSRTGLIHDVAARAQSTTALAGGELPVGLKDHIPVPEPSSLASDPALHAAIVDYYSRRRLGGQVAYFRKSLQRHHDADRRTKLFLPVLFFAVLTFRRVPRGARLGRCGQQ